MLSEIWKVSSFVASVGIKFYKLYAYTARKKTEHINFSCETILTYYNMIKLYYHTKQCKTNVHQNDLFI